MPSLAAFHPQIVHFVVSLLVIGVLFRLISLSGRLRFSDHAASALLILGTIAAAFAVRSGDDAHGPVERIPGTRALVIEHEEAGKKTRNIFFAVAAIELLALGLAAKGSTARFTRWAQVGSAVVGLWGLTELNHAAGHGGEIVYEYAGGPGLRTGNPQDVERLLLAGLYQQAAADRAAGRKEDAARLTEEMVRRFGADTTVQFLSVESLLLDRGDAPSALTALDAMGLDPANLRLASRRANLRADILLALGQPDSAKAVLSAASAAMPANARIKARLDSMP
jgi:hypothetical protein